MSSIDVIEIVYMGIGYEYKSGGEFTGLCYRNFSPATWSDVITHMEQGDEVHVVHPSEVERAQYDSMMDEFMERKLDRVKLDDFDDRCIAEHWNKMNK